MTSEEIKQHYSMREVVESYGIHINRAGFCSCPFHQGDRTPSLKIYPKDFHCHACGENGDIFSFVQLMDGCDFKTAFKKLGGAYETKSAYQHKLAQYAMRKQKETATRRMQQERARKNALLRDINMQKIFKALFPVFSDEWCDAVNRLEYDLYLLDEMFRR